MTAGKHGGWRPGSGRKPKIQGRQDVTVTLDQPSMDILTRWCDSLGVTRSEALRHLISLAPEPGPKKRKGER